MLIICFADVCLCFLKFEEIQVKSIWYMFRNRPNCVLDCHHLSIQLSLFVKWCWILSLNNYVSTICLLVNVFQSSSLHEIEWSILVSALSDHSLKILYCINDIVYSGFMSCDHWSRITVAITPWPQGTPREWWLAVNQNN